MSSICRSVSEGLDSAHLGRGVLANKLLIVAVLAAVATMDILLDLAHIDGGNLGVRTIEDLGNLLKSRALGLNVEEVNEDQFKKDPALMSNVSSRLSLGRPF